MRVYSDTIMVNGSMLETYYININWPFSMDDVFPFPLVKQNFVETGRNHSFHLFQVQRLRHMYETIYIWKRL